MLEFMEKIREQASENALAPAICTLENCVPYIELEETIAAISNYFADRRVPRLSKAYLNIGHPDLRLIGTLACMHYGIIPFIAAKPPENGEVDCDLVIGAAGQLIPELEPDLIIDGSVLRGKLADRQLREFEPRADDEILYIASTTGTTGSPKFVPLTYGQEKARQKDDNKSDTHVYSPGERFMFTVGDATKYAITIGYRLFRCKATLVRATLDRFICLKIINLYGVDSLATTPQTLQDLMALMEDNAIRCPSLKRILITGSLFTRQLIERAEKLFDAELNVGYGTSEVGVISRGKVTAKDFVPGYVGEIVPNRTFVADSGASQEPAELVLVHNEETILPYYEKGKLVRNESPSYRLPDIGQIKDGKLYLSGREDEVYNFSGKKLPFSAIEAELREHAGIADVGIVGNASPEDPLSLVIAIVSGSAVDSGQLIKQVCAELGITRAASHIQVLQTETVPRNAMGKVDRQAVLMLTQAETSLARAEGAAQDAGQA